MNILRAVFFKEMIDGFRDKRALGSALFVPIIGPAMLVLLIQTLATSTESLQDIEMVMQGREGAPELVTFLQDQGVTFLETPTLNTPAKIREAVQEGEIDFGIVIDDEFQKDLDNVLPATLTLYTDQTNKKASAKVQRATQLIMAYGGQLAHLRLLARGVNPSVAQPIELKKRDVATQEEVVAANFLGVIPLFLLMAAFIGGLSFAIDTTAGERERRSLEPLLLTPPPRWMLVTGKWMAVSVFGYMAVVLSIIGYVIAVRIAPVERLNFPLDVTPTTGVFMALVMLPTVLMASGLMLSVASFSRSFKEAQSSSTLLIFIPIIPGMLSVMNGISDNPSFALIPFLGQQMVLTSMLSGTTSMLQVGASVVISLVIAAASVLFTTRLFSREAILAVG